jgi:hypothetical protein
MNKLQIDNAPNDYKRVFYDGKPLGSYRAVPGGFEITGMRKLRPTLFQVLLDLIDRMRKAHLKELDRLDAARDEVFEREHEFKIMKAASKGAGR